MLVKLFKRKCINKGMKIVFRQVIEFDCSLLQAALQKQIAMATRCKSDISSEFESNFRHKCALAYLLGVFSYPKQVG